MKKFILGSVLAVTFFGLSLSLGTHANSSTAASGDMQVAELPVGI
ncbi:MULTISPECIES: hypothetical protein [Bacillus]|nr:MULTISPECIES: hypothetical protein [Bacillus]KYD05260.1 hypothetical protein B4144_1867 [Bacillus atrophaeus]MEC2062755.1 hypothetical protein [Bacillus inaquosorum]MEC2086102.1 hypothetical protein [Bacillus inaquosorum]MED4848169.1 hypothetical protein [Bacillus atrophaeus]